MQKEIQVIKNNSEINRWDLRNEKKQVTYPIVGKQEKAF